MGYYTIQNNSLLTAENEQALTRFYSNVYQLPADYEVDKYVVVDGELVLNPNYEQEQEEKQKQAKILEINNKIKELQEKSTYEILLGNEQNIQVYRGVIQGLKDTKEELL